MLGFNNNVRHRGRVFHIQTEDSGLKSPRIVTHLFADGGRIIKTSRTDYAAHLGASDVQQTVRQLMKEQHKAMFALLRAGDLDDLLEAACGALPLPLIPESTDLPMSSSGTELKARAARAPAESAPASAAQSKPQPVSNPNLRSMLPSVPPPSSEAIDRAVAALDVSSSPATALRGPVKSEPNRARMSAPVEQTPVGRPASRYGSAPGKAARSIFGEGVISEKSLDEVILSYLAEDLDGSSD